MAISLRRYEPQVGVSAQTGTQSIGVGLASSMIQEAGARDQLISSTMQTVGDIAEKISQSKEKEKKEIAKKEEEAAKLLQKEKEAIQKETEALQKEADKIQTKNEVKTFEVDYNTRETALLDSLKNVKNKEEADVLIKKFVEDTDTFIKNNTYLPQSMQEIKYSRIGENKKFEIEAAAAVASNNAVERINILELIRSEAEIGQRTEAEFNTATDELVRENLDKKYTPAWAVEQKANFTLKKNYNITTSALKTNIPQAEKMFAELKFNPTDSDKLQTSIFIANQNADEQAEREQGRILNSFEQELEAGDLFPTELKGLNEDVFYINGKEYPSITENELKLLTMSVNNQASSELQDPIKNGLFNTTLRLFNDFALKGEKITEDDINNIITTVQEANFSPVVYNDLLTEISISKKTKMNPDQIETFVAINNAFESFAIEYTGDIAVQKHLMLMKSFNKMLDGEISIDELKQSEDYKDMLQITSTVKAENRINNTNNYNTFFDEVGFD